MSDAPLSLSAALQATIDNAGEMPGFLTQDRTYRWAEVGQRVMRLAGALRELGVKPQTRFAILSRSSIFAEEIKWAGLWLGAVPVPVNWRFSVLELAHVLNDSSVTLIAVDAVSLPVLRSAEFTAWHSRLVLLGNDRADGVLNSEDLIAAAIATPRSELDEHADAMVFYTGGTTGRSKGVRLTHRNIYINALQIAANLRPLRSDIYLHVSPTFHTASLLSTCFIMRGSAHVYLPAFNPVDFMRAVAQFQVTATDVVPAMLIKLMTDPQFGHYNLTSLRTVMFGASSMTADWVKRLAQHFPNTDFIHGYGLTETSPNLAALEPELLRLGATDPRQAELLQSCGKPLLGVDMRIVDNQGQTVPRGESGEVLVRCPNLMPGYLNRPADTASVIQDGWLRTGDVGRFDAQGNLYILDRLKDMIVTGGENVYSAEVETVLAAHDSVSEAAVFPVPHPVFGEAVAAAVVQAGETQVSPDELLGHCRGRLAGYKVPRLIVFVDELPKTAVGKINKIELRARFPDSTAFMPANGRQAAAASGRD